MPGPFLDVRPCPEEDRPAALAVLYRRMPESLRPRLVRDALEDAADGLIDLTGLWVASARGRIAGVLLSQTLVGQAGAVWAPEVVSPWGRRRVAAALVRSALEDMTRRGLRIAQALVDRTGPRSASGDLIRGGMPRVTHLTYMARPTKTPLLLPPSTPQFRWASYGPETDGEFRAILGATYEGSLDMPELEGVRSLDDVLASHQASGRFDPRRWRIGRLDGEPEAGGIVLLTDQPERESWEVAYLGLAPRARGRGARPGRPGPCPGPGPGDRPSPGARRGRPQQAGRAALSQGRVRPVRQTGRPPEDPGRSVVGSSGGGPPRTRDPCFGENSRQFTTKPQRARRRTQRRAWIGYVFVASFVLFVASW